MVIFDENLYHLPYNLGQIIVNETDITPCEVLKANFSREPSLELVFKDETGLEFKKTRVIMRLERGLNKMINQAQKQDLVLVYYSGHGKQSKSGQLYLTNLDTEVAIL